MIIILLIAIIFSIRHISRKRKSQRMTPKQTAAAERLRIAEAKRMERIRKENERRQAQEEKQRQKIAQAEQDLPFYEAQLERLYPTAESLRHQYRQACDSVNHDEEMNQYGAVIKDKVINDHISERDKLLKKLITAENTIHSLEKKLSAAQAILSI